MFGKTFIFGIISVILLQGIFFLIQFDENLNFS